MKVVAIIQARMGSSRLPGKVLADIHGKSMLFHVVRRTQAAKSLNEVIVATTTEPADEAIIKFCETHRVSFLRGSEHDVLDRYYRAALQQGAEVVVRITSDCPMIDPGIVDETVKAFLLEMPDYASNTIVRTYPRGLDTEVMTFAALERAWSEAKHPYQRTHVTPYMYEHPELFRVLSVSGQTDYSAYRWTVDTPEDLELVRTIYSRLGNDMFSLEDALQLMEKNPQLGEINRSIMQKMLVEG